MKKAFVILLFETFNNPVIKIEHLIYKNINFERLLKLF